MMQKLAPEATRQAAEEQATSVEVVRVAPETASARIVTSGVVEPARRITIVPEVAGRIVRLSENLVAGGRVEEGELLVKIDPREYQLALEQQETQVSRAELELEQELGRQSIARREWELLGEDQDGASKSLVLREPHLTAAKESVRAARSAIERARLSLSRTVIKAPFNASVTSESVEVGQVVGPGAPIATLIGSDRFWVRVSVPIGRLTELSIPGVKQGGAMPELGSPARIVQTLTAGKALVREGNILRLESELDPESRTAQVIIGIDDPLDPDDGGLPLLPRAFVRVELEGTSRAGVTTVPAKALHEGDTVWVVNGDERLAARRVEVGFADEDVAHVLSGLEPGARVVVSPLALPIEGMKVRVEGPPHASAPRDEHAGAAAGREPSGEQTPRPAASVGADGPERGGATP